MKAFLLLLLLPFCVLAQNNVPIPSDIHMPKIEEDIVPDGELNEPAWQKATLTNQFYEIAPSVENPTSPVPIEVKTMYNQNYLYVSMKITDDPKSIRANLGNRDTGFSDDFGMIMIDTYNTQSFAYLVGATAKNVQLDGRKTTGGNDDIGFNLLFDSGAKITETGYNLEFAIPFSSLRFPEAQQQKWRMSFVIIRPRDNRYQISNTPLDRNNSCFLCQWVAVNGISDIKAARLPIEVVPALVGSQQAFRNNNGLEAEKIKIESFDPSVTVKYPLNSSATAELTLNPDFSQIEADASRIDVNNTFSLFFEERRPFFQEGSELFSMWIDQVYTRSINNPLLAGKFIGRYGNTSVGYIGAFDENSPVVVPFEEFSRTYRGGKSVSNILRLRQSFGKQGSYVGALITDRRFAEGSKATGSSVGFDALIRLNQTYQIEAQVVGSHTQESLDSNISANLAGVNFDGHTGIFDGESFTGWGTYLSFERNSKAWWADIDLNYTSPTLRLDNGALFQNARKKNSISLGYNFYFKDKSINEFEPFLSLGTERDFKNQLKDIYLYSGLNANFKKQTNSNIGILWFSNEFYRGKQFNGMQRIEASVNRQINKKLALGLGTAYGESIFRSGLALGKGKSFNIGIDYNPTAKFLLSPEFNYQDLKDEVTGNEFFSGFIARNKMSWQFSKPLSIRIINEYNSFAKGISFQPLLTYQVNPLSVFYIGANWDYSKPENQNKYAIWKMQQEDPFLAQSRSLFFKFQYLFSV